MTSLGPRSAGIPVRIGKLLRSLAVALLLALLLSRPECGLTPQPQADPSPPQTLDQLLRSLGCEMRSWGIGEDKQGQVHGILGAELLARTQALIDFDQTSLWFVPAPGRAGDKR